MVVKLVKPNGISHFYKFDQSISILRVDPYITYIASKPQAYVCYTVMTVQGFGFQAINVYLSMCFSPTFNRTVTQ